MNHSETIIRLSSEHFGIPIEQLVSKTRKREVVVCRHSAMVMLKEFTQMSLKSIGQCFGGRDHSSVMHAISAVQDLEDTDVKFADRLYLLKDIIVQNIFPTQHVKQTKEDQIDQEFEHLLP